MTTAIPEVKCQIPHEFRMGVFDVDRGAQTADVACDVVGEDYAAHAGFAGAGFAHEEDFAFAGGGGGSGGQHGGWSGWGQPWVCDCGGVEEWARIIEERMCLLIVLASAENVKRSRDG